MREVSGPAIEPLPTRAHLLMPIIERASHDPGWPVASYRDGDHYVDVTAGVFYQRVRQLSRGLIGLGVEAGDRVALMSHTRLEWLLVDYAILATGGVTVPVYETSSAEQVRWILGDSGAAVSVVETAAMREMHAAAAHHTPTWRGFAIEAGGLDELVRLGERIDEATLDARIAEVTSDRLATIVYTSGTTGRPKGCAITHGNLCANVVQNLDAARSMLEADDVGLMFLPLAHTLARIIALVGVEWGIKLAFVTDLAHLQEELALARPTLVVAVPRVFEKVFNAAQQKAETERRTALFDRATDVAICWSEGRAAAARHPWKRLEHALLSRLVYSKVRAVFGGRMRFAVSGGGPLGARLTHFFNGVGVKIFEGYGLTETSPTLTVNRAEAWKPGTVGRPVAGTSIRIAKDGEVLAKGPQVFQGYWRNDAATTAAFDADGWFLTGDVGMIDEDGFLRITGRKKEIIVTAAGKNVAPAPIEDRLRAHPLISQAVVVGDGRPFVAALITLDAEAVGHWAAVHDMGAMAMIEVVETAELRADIQAAVDAANGSVSRAESIREFAVLPEDLTVAAGELTPTLKVRRAVVDRRYADVIDRIFGQPAPDQVGVHAR